MVRPQKGWRSPVVRKNSKIRHALNTRVNARDMRPALGAKADCFPLRTDVNLQDAKLRLLPIGFDPIEVSAAEPA